MILPNVRASFGRREAQHLLYLMAREDPWVREAAEERLRTRGIDALLDDPRTLNAVLTDRDVNVPPGLVFYLLARHALLEGGIDDRTMADYLAALLLHFGRERRAYRISEEDETEYHYLVDMIGELADVKGRRGFLLRAHLGNFSLWLAGLFADYIEHRVERKGAPPLEYYEEVGATGFRLAADTVYAEAYGLDALYREAADRFPSLRLALNRLADRYFWPGAGNPVSRLIREVSGRFPRRRGR